MQLLGLAGSTSKIHLASCLLGDSGESAVDASLSPKGGVSGKLSVLQSGFLLWETSTFSHRDFNLLDEAHVEGDCFT